MVVKKKMITMKFSKHDVLFLNTGNVFLVEGLALKKIMVSSRR